MKICDALPRFIGNIREKSFGTILEESPFIGDIVLRNQELQANPFNTQKAESGCIAYQFANADHLKAPDLFHPNASFAYSPGDMQPITKEKVPFVEDLTLKEH